jgi:hypothetical protein
MGVALLAAHSAPASEQSGVKESPRATEPGRGAESRAEKVAFYGVVLLAIAAPFELQAPVLALPGQSISNLEACLCVAFGAWLVALAIGRTPPVWRTPLTWPWAASIGVMALASLLSPVSKANALHMTGRAAAAFAVYLLSVNGLRNRERVRALLIALLATGTSAAVLALMEYQRIGVVVTWLRAFRPDFAWLGAQLRAGGPFQYPSIASMYLEVVFACGLGLWTAGRATSGWTTPLLFGALLLVADAIVFSYTRAGLVTVGVSLVAVGVLRYRGSGFDIGTTMVASLAVAIALLVLTSRPVESLWLRFTTEGQEAWYRMSVDAPQEITFRADAIATIPVAVTNVGRVTWDSRADPPFSFTSHWYDADGTRAVAFYGIRNVFPSAVKPGETVLLDARVRAPRDPGTYQLAWDIEYKNRLWFSTEQGATPSVSRATVTGGPAPPAAARTAVPRAAVRPGRIVLWRAAVLMLSSYPLFGVGPDNFRLAYGPYAALPSADDRVHSNNMYLELTVGAGCAGAFAFAWLFWRIARLVRDMTHTAHGSAAATGVGVSAAIVAIALHGFVDSFLAFTPTYVLFALVLGAASSLSGGAPRARSRGMGQSPI